MSEHDLERERSPDEEPESTVESEPPINEESPASIEKEASGMPDDAQPEPDLCPEEEPVPTAEGPALLDTVMAGIETLSERIGALETLFQSKILHAAHEEKIVDQMHKELQTYKKDMYSQLTRPILLDIIVMRDGILNVVAAYREKPEEERFVPLSDFELSADEAEEILEKNQVEVYKSDEGSEFVPVRQKALKKITTDNPELHGKVEKSLSDGYSYNGRTISPEKVNVYVYEKPRAENTEEEAQ